jgi:CheY-like chemotaxis protein
MLFPITEGNPPMPKILIVEDNVLIADLLEDYLLSGGHDVCGVACSVTEAVALAELHKPDMAIVDFRLGDGTDGTQIRPLLQDRFSMKMLYVSADDLHDTLTPEDGDAYIRKPYSIDDLLTAVHIVLTGGAETNCLPGLYPRNFYLLGAVDIARRQCA